MVRLKLKARTIIDQHLKVPNCLADDSNIAGTIETVGNSLQSLLGKAKIYPKPLLVCSGGTSTRCAADGHWTLDLRNCCRSIEFNSTKNTVKLGGGNKMSELTEFLSKKSRLFPIGLSGITGMGYILTGGISPLSRQYGLAIDQLEEIKGFWGSGISFNLSKPTELSSNDDLKYWRGMTGAAAFLGIVTSVTLKTYPLRKIYIWRSKVTKSELESIIQESEGWMSSCSLQWHWGNDIEVLSVMVSNMKTTKNTFRKIIEKAKLKKEIEIEEINNLNQMTGFQSNTSSQKQIYSEVISLLGPQLGNSRNKVISTISKLIQAKPHPKCSISVQQLGAQTKEVLPSFTSFVNRDSMWKLWITACWEKDDLEGRLESLRWLKNAWESLSPFFPWIHLAQMHQHLPWHEKEVKSAFGDWLTGLKQLKRDCDPNDLLPPL